MSTVSEQDIRSDFRGSSEVRALEEVFGERSLEISIRFLVRGPIVCADTVVPRAPPRTTTSTLRFPEEFLFMCSIV